MQSLQSCPALRQATHKLSGVASCAYGSWRVVPSAQHQRVHPRASAPIHGSRQQPCPQRLTSLTGTRTVTRAGAAEAPEATDQELWSADDLYRDGAVRLQALMAALPELDEEALGSLLSGNPGLTAREPQEVRSDLEALASALGLTLLRAARLAGRVPAVWEAPPAEAAAKVKGMARELGVGVDAALELYAAQPGMWAVSQPSIIKDRLETLATKLGLPLPAFVGLVGRQALLWVVPPAHVACTVRDVESGLGLTGPEAQDLIVRAPPVLALEPRLLRCSVQGVSAASGVPAPALLELLSKSLGLAAVPTQVLADAVQALAGDLGVRPEDVVGLMARQPTLLCAQQGSILAALDTLETGLRLDRSAALAVLVSQPSLMYETTVDTLVTRVEALAETFRLASVDEAHAVAVSQPALLAVAPATVRSATSVVGSNLGSSAKECLDLAKSDPGAYIMVTLQESLIEAWSGRLQLPPDAVSQLLSAQPALLELTPTTVKARLESLAALFRVPLALAAQLLLKHPALGAVPPNATITRAKNVSSALRISMQGAADLIAKEPALLAVLATASAELRAPGPAGPTGAAAGAEATDILDDVGEVGAVYEYFTMEWLQRQVREMSPGRVTSFSALDR